MNKVHGLTRTQAPHLALPGSWEKRWLLRYLPWLMLAFCMTVTLLVWKIAASTTNKALMDYFDLRSHEVFSSIEKRLQTYE